MGIMIRALTGDRPRVPRMEELPERAFWRENALISAPLRHHPPLEFGS